MTLVDLIDLLSERVAEEVNRLRAEMLALIVGSSADASSTGLVTFDGGSAVLPAGYPIVDGGSA